MISREQAQQALLHEPHLAEIYELERNRVEAILDTALRYDNPDCRWEYYEALKGFSSQFVGRNAQRPELKTSAHYEEMLSYISWVLTEMEQAS